MNYNYNHVNEPNKTFTQTQAGRCSICWITNVVRTSQVFHAAHLYLIFIFKLFPIVIKSWCRAAEELLKYEQFNDGICIYIIKSYGGLSNSRAKE